MIRKSTTQVRAISGNTPEETAALFNETMMELSQLHPTYERDGKMFWIFYNVVVEEPETSEEVFEMNGQGAHCIDCPFCSRDLNRFGEPHGRKKWATCAKTGERVCINSRACVHYYDTLTEGGE